MPIPSPRRRRSLRHGSGSSRFPSVHLRLPPETLERIEVLADQADQPLWQIVADAVAALPDAVPAGAS